METNPAENALKQLEHTGTNTDSLTSIDGWYDIKKEDISYEGMLYPESYRFQVKPVTAGTIKYFSSLDESNPLSVNDALTYVVKHHVRIFDGQKKLDSVETIYEHDRFNFTMLVHRWSGNPTTLTFKGNCTHTNCRHEQDIDINSKTIMYRELTEKAKTWLNTKEGLFVIETKTLGTRKWRPLTLSESTELIHFIHEQTKKSSQIEQSFLTMSGFFIHDRPANDNAQDLYNRYLTATSDVKEVSLLQEILNHLTIGQLLEVSIESCTKCKNPFQHRITSLEGLRRIFLVHDISSEL